MTADQVYSVNGVELAAETFGSAADPPILLIHGATASMLWWADEFCSLLADRGRYVIRYDQRDTGRSTSYPVGGPEYSDRDLAADAIGLLDALGIDRAHVVGQSWSGGIALILGVGHPSRVASLTFVSTSTGADGLPSSTMPQLEQPDLGDRAAVEDYVVRAIEAEELEYFDEFAARDLVRRDLARARDYRASLTNHYAASIEGPAQGGFEDLTMPVMVVHGSSDPVLPLPHGEAIRDAVPGARMVVLPRAGHGVPRPLWPVFVNALVEHTGGG
jgi:pimeloyl-ACP methyl ester carboxylesterase